MMKTDQHFPPRLVRFHPKSQYARFAHNNRDLIEVHDIMGIGVNFLLVVTDREFERRIPGKFFCSIGLRDQRIAVGVDPQNGEYSIPAVQLIILRTPLEYQPRSAPPFTIRFLSGSTGISFSGAYSAFPNV